MVSTLDTPTFASEPQVHDDGTIDLPDERMARLRRLNVVMGMIHLASATAMVVLGNTEVRLPVSTFDIGGPPGTGLDEGSLSQVATLPIAYGTALFSGLSAFFHLSIASIGWERYRDELAHGRNRFRWVEYSLSATVMIVLIAQVTGILDLAALTAIAFANVAMILFGWLMETTNPPRAREQGRVSWTPFWFGCVAGAGPWVAIFVTLGVNLSDGGAGPPGFVYGIIATLFLLFNCFAVNQWLQYRGKGRFADHLFGETVYQWLSLIAKVALAWQIFVNVLVDQTPA